MAQIDPTKKNAAAKPAAKPAAGPKPAAKPGLPGALKPAAEQRMGADFSGVRVHADGAADQMSRQLGARAATAGSNIYAPGGPKKNLVADELSHVIQPGKPAGAAKPGNKPPPKR